MKIVHIGPSVRQTVTGGQRQRSQLLAYLRESTPVLLRRLEPCRQRGRFGFVFDNLWYVRHLFELRGSGVLVLEDYSHRLSLVVFNWIASWFTRAKLVCTVNAFDFSYRRSTFKNWVDLAVGRLALQPVDMIITAGEAAVVELRRLYNPKCPIGVVYPALRQEFLAAKPGKRNTHQSEFHLIYVGRFHPVKGVEYLVEALSLLPDKSVKLTVVGDTLYHPEYGRRVMSLVEAYGLRDRVSYAGVVKDTRALIQLYREADLVVLPSLWETSPIVLVEAMCLGVPAVASRVGGVTDYVEDGVNGLLIPPKDSQALSDAIRRLSRDRYYLETLRENALKRSRVHRCRSWEHASEEYYSLFKMCLGDHSLDKPGGFVT